MPPIYQRDFLKKIDPFTGTNSTQRTSGQLWIRLASAGGLVRALWGVGTSNNIPTTWTVSKVGRDESYAICSFGTYCKVETVTIDTSVAAGFVVGFLDIRTLSMVVGI